MAFTWSFDRLAEVWGNDVYSSVDECIVAARAEDELCGGRHGAVYVGETAPFVPSASVDLVLDMIEGTAADECGEIGHDWDAYDNSKQAELDELQLVMDRVICAWLRKYGYWPEFYSVEDVREYVLN
jgi:hypothetical protein